MKKAMSCGLIVLALAMTSVYAAPPNNRPPHNRPPDHGQTKATNEAAASAEASADSYSEGSTSSSFSEGGDSQSASSSSSSNEIGISSSNSSSSGGNNYRSESNNTNVVLVPNNNTSTCLRVWGISFGTHEGAAGLGIPTRDKSCDFDAAADDAAATGNHKIAWWWRCHKKPLYRTFSADSDEQAILKCWNSMNEMMSQPGSDDPVPAGQVIIPENEYHSLLMAQVQQEQVEGLEDQIESLKQEDLDKDAEIERLKRESARLRAEQKEAEQRDAARRAAALKALDKKSEGS